MKLYGYWTSNPQKIRLALEEIGEPYEYEYLDLAQGHQKTPEFKVLHPRQKVPLLVDGDAVLWESGAALVYLSQNLCGCNTEKFACKINCLNYRRNCVRVIVYISPNTQRYCT